MKLLAALFLALLALTAAPNVVFAAENATYVAPLADPVLEARAKALQKELRCLVCQGQSIDESNADLAIDLKKLIREQIQAGQSNDQIKDFLVARYGIFVLMQPPVRQDTYFLWFVPAILLLIGGAAIGVTILNSRRRLSAEGPADDIEPPV